MPDTPIPSAVMSDRRWTLLVEAIEQMSSARSVEDVAAVIRSAARRLSGADGVTFVLREADRCHYLDENAIAPLWKGRRFPMSACVSGWCMLNGRTAIIPDIYTDPRIPQDAYRRTFVRSLVMVPVRAEDPLAAIGAYWAEIRQPQLQVVDALEALARSTATALANVALYSSLRESENRLRVAVAAGKLGLWELDLASRTLSASAVCKANFGREADAEFTYDELVSTIHPDDREPMLVVVAESVAKGMDCDIEYRVVWPNGEVRWVQMRGRPTHDDAFGRPLRMAGVSLDTTDRRRAEENRKLLLDELNHRVKNTLATVQSISAQTLRSAASPAAFQEAFEPRLLALSQAHNLLAKSDWRGASLKEVVLAALTPYATDDTRFTLTGEDVHLGSRAAVVLGMALHELATNAAKYGALSAPAGRVAVIADRRATPDGRWLRLDWHETGGPPVPPPKRKGFGSRLIEQSLAYELAGQVHLEFAPSGVQCSMELPIGQETVG